MKITRKLSALLLALTLLFSLALTGCQPKADPIAADKVAVVLYDMMLKNDASSAVEIFGYESEEAARADMGMDSDLYSQLADQIAAQFESMGATVTSEDVQTFVNAFLSMFQHVEFSAEVTRLDETAKTAVVTCTVSTFAPDALENAMADAMADLTGDELDTADADDLYSILLTKLAEAISSITPDGGSVTFESEFELGSMPVNGRSRPAWVPVDAEQFGSDLSLAVLGG